MDYHLSDADRYSIGSAIREVILGLTLASGEVRVRRADSAMYPGHRQWIERDQIPMSEITGGFSLIVKDGQVTGFFRSSELNRTPDWQLADDHLQAVLATLPLSTDFRLY